MDLLKGTIKKQRDEIQKCLCELNNMKREYSIEVARLNAARHFTVLTKEENIQFNNYIASLQMIKKELSTQRPVLTEEIELLTFFRLRKCLISVLTELQCVIEKLKDINKEVV